MNHNPQFIKLREAWDNLAQHPFWCWQAATVTQAIIGGVIMGYWHRDNPTALLGESEGGHDFLIVEDHWILDFWATAYHGESPVHDLADSLTVSRLYGDKTKWVVVTKGETNGITAISSIRSLGASLESRKPHR